MPSSSTEPADRRSPRSAGEPPPKLRALLLAAAMVMAVDLPLKFWAEHSLSLGERVGLVDGLVYLTHARNPGGAFGFLEHAAGSALTLAFALASTAALAVIASFYQRLAPGDRASARALGLILGGVGSNLFDRLWRAEVVDFLHLRLWAGYGWPDFNLADVAIVLGVATLIRELLVSEVLLRRRRLPPRV